MQKEFGLNDNFATLLHGKDSFENESFAEADFSGQEVVGKEFYRCSFMRCRFANVFFKNSRFENCQFQDCDLSLIKQYETRFIDVYFKGCKLLGINWTKVGQPLMISFEECIMGECNFFGLNLSRLKFFKCQLRNADFAEAKMVRSDLRQSDLSGARFANTDLSQANFVGATNYAIDPKGNKIAKARFSLPEAVSLLAGMNIIIE